MSSLWFSKYTSMLEMEIRIHPAGPNHSREFWEPVPMRCFWYLVQYGRLQLSRYLVWDCDGLPEPRSAAEIKICADGDSTGNPYLPDGYVQVFNVPAQPNPNHYRPPPFTSAVPPLWSPSSIWWLREDVVRWDELAIKRIFYCDNSNSGGRPNQVIDRGYGDVLRHCWCWWFSAFPHYSTLAGTESARSPPALGNAKFNMISMTENLGWYYVGRHNSQESKSSHGNTRTERSFSTGMVSSVASISKLLSSRSFWILVENTIEVDLFKGTPVLKTCSAGRGFCMPTRPFIL